MKIGKLELKKTDLAVRHHCQFKMAPFPEIDGLETMRRGCNLLDKAQIHHWISSGNLLGIYRDGKLIPHDTDIDVNISMDWDTLETNILCKQIFTAFTNNGFEPARTVIWNNHFFQLCFKDQINEVLFDMYFFYKGIVPRHTVNINPEGIMKKPLKFVNKLDHLVYKGVEYPIPNHIEDFLTWRFGNWKTPTKSKSPWQEDASCLERWV